MDRNVLLGYGFAVAGVISGVLNNFWLLREVAGEVSKSDLGTYVIVLAITTYASLAQFGVGAAASQDFAQALAAGQEARAARTYAQLSFFNRAIFASCSLLTVAVAGVIHVTADGESSPLAAVVLWTGLCIAVRFLFNASSAALQGAQAVHVVSVVQLVTNLLAVVLGYFLLRAGTGIVCLPLGQFGASIVGVMLLRWQRRSRCTWAGGQKAVRAGFGDLLRFGAAVNMTVALTMVETCIEPAIFQLVSPDPLIETASYHVWSRVPAMAQVLTVTLVANTAPALAAKLQADPAAGLSFYRRLVWLALVIAACLVLGIGMWLASTVHVWMAGEYDTAQGTNLALCFALVAGARSLLFAVASAFYPLHRVRIVIAAFLMQLVAKLLLGLALASMLGLTGMALAYALSVLLALVYLAAHACNLGLLHRQQLWVATAVTPLAAAVVYVLTPAIACHDLGCLIEGVLITGLLLGILVLAGLWQLSRKTREP